MELAIAVQGLDKAMARTSTKAAHLRETRKAMTVAKLEFEQLTEEAFAASKSPQGEAFPPLAQSTLAARARASKGARKRKKSGELTAAALRIRSRIMGPGGATPLVDSGNLRNSMHWYVTNAGELVLSMPAYGLPHVTGSIKRAGHPPKRNPTPFERGDGGGLEAAAWRLAPGCAARLRELLLRGT